MIGEPLFVIGQRDQAVLALMKFAGRLRAIRRFRQF